ncbi:hypothetical protein PTKIN_Ptkin09bG0241000 [Pterospermum kingtungense]
MGCVFIGEANTTPIIGNPAIGRDLPGGCNGGNCLPPPSNPAQRGCEKTFRCREAPPTLEEVAPPGHP